MVSGAVGTMGVAGVAGELPSLTFNSGAICGFSWWENLCLEKRKPVVESGALMLVAGGLMRKSGPALADTEASTSPLADSSSEESFPPSALSFFFPVRFCSPFFDFLLSFEVEYD